MLALRARMLAHLVALRVRLSLALLKQAMSQRYFKTDMQEKPKGSEVLRLPLRGTDFVQTRSTTCCRDNARQGMRNQEKARVDALVNPGP